MKIFKTQRKIAVSAEKIFAAFENAELLAKWWGPKDFTNTFGTFEFKTNGKWSFIMHGPDGTNYPNENLFQEIQKPNKIVIRHNCDPFFTATINITDTKIGSIIEFNQDFDNDEIAKNIAHIVKPSNEQLLDRLQSLVENKK